MLDLISDGMVDERVDGLEFLAEEISAGEDACAFGRDEGFLCVRGGEMRIEGIENFHALPQVVGLEERRVGFTLRDEVVKSLVIIPSGPL